ncbi:GpcrRhopsn4 domain-containing protein [Meloidogyne graminicola]|uniref:GpcrRhopsn4 domain-containing protein n=1 Tax=Meloidogyne graminicola TaxID=189291 RepID=A0A8S9ZRL8_9BILA|nr:GpcrRhopsn4 domain-containing protein [Meloidogyne graminicola]
MFNWEYLDRFCFISNEGTFKYNIYYPMNFELQSIYMYYDTDNQWKAIYNNNSLSCNDKERILDPKNYQIIRLSPSAKFIDEQSNCEIINKNNNESWYHCFGKRSFFSMRPRWWYFAIGNCDTQNGLYLEYYLLMTNSNNKTNHLLKNRKMLHITFRLFFHSIFCELIASTLLWMHYDNYAENGQGMPLLKFFSMILRQFSIVLFVLLLFLIGKGYTITRAKISICSSIKIIFFISTYFILKLLMLAWEIIIFDPAQITYMSESIPAYCIIYLNIFGWLWFLRCSWVTTKKYPLKKRFYMFWSSPIILLIANFILDNWVREEIIQGVDSAIINIANQQNNFPNNVYEVQYIAQPTLQNN